MRPPRLVAASVTIGTSKPRELAAFYARLLNAPLTAEEPDGGWAQIRCESGLTLNFEFERHHVRPDWPTVSGGQNPTQHLDILVDDLDSAVAWAAEGGAVPANFQPQDDVRVMFDPDGHPFCLFR